MIHVRCQPDNVNGLKFFLKHTQTDGKTEQQTESRNLQPSGATAQIALAMQIGIHVLQLIRNCS